MQKTHDNTLIFITVVFILFILSIIYVFSSNQISKNSEHIASDINLYEEHEHEKNTTINEDTKTDIVLTKTTYEDIATYTTNIYDKDNNRVYNIKLACHRLDGHIVAPNEEFSFNTTMGKMGEADGYKKALGFDSNGNKIKVFGGRSMSNK